MARKPATFLLSLVVLATTLTMIFVWLPFWRAVIDGPSYQWGFTLFDTMFRGAGTGGDFPMLLTLMASGTLVLFLAARGGPQPTPILLLLWHGMWAASSTYEAVTRDEPVIFQGDTLGVTLDVTYIFPAAYGVFFLLTAIWAVPRLTYSDTMREGISVLNWIATVLLLGLMGAAFYWLRDGEAHGTTDGYGVFAVIAALIVFPLAVSGKKPARL